MIFQISTIISGEISIFTLTNFFSKYDDLKTLSHVKSNLQTRTASWDWRIPDMLITYLNLMILSEGYKKII